MADVRLIDANALKKDLKNMLARVMYESDLDFDHSHEKIWTATITGIQHSIKRLDNAPTIDAVPVVRCRECTRSRPLNDRERLIFTPQCMKCTSSHGCGVEYPEYDIDGRIVFEHGYCSYGNRKPQTKEQQICPNCGAKMDGGADDGN